MSNFDANSYSEAELLAVFERLFPHGFAGSDVLQEIAPEGWERSPLFAIFHPSVEQTFEEALQMHRNLSALRKPDDLRPLPPPPTREEVAKGHSEHPPQVESEVRDLIGMCLWDTFSDGHEVFGADGRLLDLGSFRGSGGFLADLLNIETRSEQYDYLNFYMGTIWVARRADLAPVYRAIFRRFRALGLDWVYHFPRLGIVDLRPMKEALEQKDKPEWTDYNPEESLAKEQADEEHDRNLAELRESLDAGYRESVEQALEEPPPATVRAYEAVFGRFPRGWPPTI